MMAIEKIYRLENGSEALNAERKISKSTWSSAVQLLLVGLIHSLAA
jgi:hypothetical protein